MDMQSAVVITYKCIVNSWMKFWSKFLATSEKLKVAVIVLI